MFDFLNITFIDILDISLVGILIYEVFKLIRGTSAISIFVGIISIYFIWFVVSALKMTILSTILGQVLGVGVIALIVIFKQEIRRFLIHFGNSYVKVARRREGIFRFIKGYGKGEETISAKSLEEITAACRRMSATKTGALMVFQHSSSLSSVIESGDKINADINRRLIENLFFKNSPLHDGALILTPTKIISARCTLPISHDADINPQYGMRHRAAIGITEETDAEVIVVSEETGNISYVVDGEIKTMNSINELRLALENSYSSR
jgi:uncharacterized protein (TIGR00159 family)